MTEPMPAVYSSAVPISTTGAMPISTYGGYSMPMPAMPAMSGLDHSQGKWFAPGEALPPGFVVTTHPEGHTEPQSHHLMSDKARVGPGTSSIDFFRMLWPRCLTQPSSFQALAS